MRRVSSKERAATSSKTAWSAAALDAYWQFHLREEQRRNHAVHCHSLSSARSSRRFWSHPRRERLGGLLNFYERNAACTAIEFRDRTGSEFASARFGRSLEFNGSDATPFRLAPMQAIRIESAAERLEARIVPTRSLRHSQGVASRFAFRPRELARRKRPARVELLRHSVLFRLWFGNAQCALLRGQPLKLGMKREELVVF